MKKLLLLLTLVLPAPVHAGDWPQWRGPQRDGVWRDHGLPERLSLDGLTPRWKQPIGGGFGGIAVAGRRLYVMDRQKQPREVERVLCLDPANGKQLWSHEYS